MSQFNLKTLKLEGQLSKFTNIVTGYKYRYFVVNNDLARLDYFMSEEMKHQKPRGSIELENAVISPSEEDSTTFLIHTIDNELFKLRALDAKERQHWVNVLRFVSQSFKNSDSHGDSASDITRRGSKSQAQIIQNEKCTFELVKEVLSQVKSKQNALDQLINNLAVKSGRIARHDKGILMLKATARACTNCITESCSIIKSIQNKKLISSTSRAIGLKKQMQHIEKKTDIKQNITSYPFSHLSLTPTDVYNGAKSEYVNSILPKSSDRTLSMSLPPSSESPQIRTKSVSQLNKNRPGSDSSDLTSEVSDLRQPVLHDSSNNDSS